MTASSTFTRVVTGAALVAILVAALALSGPYLFGLLLVFSLAGLWEFYGMFWSGRDRLCGRVLGLVLAALILAAAWLRPESFAPALGVATLAIACLFLFSWAKDEERRFDEAAVLAAGILYVPLLLMPTLRCGLPEQCLLVCVPAASDTAAYFVGMRFGRRKIWPKVSPKKSVEGAAAGLAASVLVSLFFGFSFGVGGVVPFFLLGLGLGVMAQLGDFFESALKRSRSIKDSGKILPGHGGVLDRVDSLLFVVPSYAAAASLWTFF